VDVSSAPCVTQNEIGRSDAVIRFVIRLVRRDAAMLHNLSVERRRATAEILMAAASTLSDAFPRSMTQVVYASRRRVARDGCTLRAPRGVASARIAEENRRLYS
jgi:hypothetical protein